ARVLHDHRDARAANVAHLALAGRHEVDAVELHLMRPDAPVPRREAQQRPARLRLARARLADDPQPFAAELERDAANRLDPAAWRLEGDVQVLDGKERLHPAELLGSRTSRRP